MSPWSRRLLLLVPVALFTTLTLYWHHRGAYGPDGDEPHYLVIADSIARDVDIDVANNYAAERRSRRFYPPGLSDTHAVSRDGAAYSVHGIGLPLLLALPVRAAGSAGARAVTLSITGLLSFMFFVVARRLLDSDGWALGVTLALTTGLPLVAGAGQIYPDLASGLGILFVAESILSRKVQSRSVWLAGAAAAVACLPWVHVKNVAPALILVAGSWLLRGRHRRAPAALAAAFAASVAALLAYHLLVFGALRGPYWPGSMLWSPARVIPVFLGLHWDQAHGIFLQQPLWLLGLGGLYPFARSRPREAAIVGATYLAILVPNAMHETLYGGYSFIGRLMWAALPLWLYPFCRAFVALRSPRWRAGLLIGSFFWQSMLVYGWRRQGTLLSTRSLDNSLYPWATGWLPAYHDPSGAWFHMPNHVFVVIGLLILLTGAWLVGRATNGAREASAGAGSGHGSR